MRIGIYTDCFYYPVYGGVNRLTYEVITRLAKLDKKNEYVLFNNSGAADASAFGIDQPTFRTVMIPGPRKLLWGRWMLLRRPLVERWTGPLDVVHSPAHFVVPTAASFVMTALDTFVMQAPEMFGTAMKITNSHAFRNAARRATALIAISETTKADVAKHTSIPAEKMEVIYCGISEAFLEGGEGGAMRVRQKLGIRGDYFLNLGIIQPRKNQCRLIEAYNSYRAAHPGDDIQLVLAGQKGWLTGEFDKCVEQSPYRNDIIVPGRVDAADIGPLMRGAAAFVFPTMFEGFGIPAIEAMACGVPVAASDIPVLREVAGDCAMYFDPLDVKSIAAALSALRAASPEQRAETVRRGLERAKSDMFNWDRIAERYLETYERASKTKK